MGNFKGLELEAADQAEPCAATEAAPEEFDRLKNEYELLEKNRKFAAVLRIARAVQDFEHRLAPHIDQAGAEINWPKKPGIRTDWEGASMKTLTVISGVLIFSWQAYAGFEVTNPEEMTTCLRSYIQHRLVSPESPQWEHEPKYEFTGKYLHASWHSNVTLEYGTMFAFVGPEDPIYCDYETQQDGSPDRSKPGFCKANVTDGDVTLEYTRFDGRRGPLRPCESLAGLETIKFTVAYSESAVVIH
ncbi:MAG: hypothetical protein AB7G93_23290 [Bdellovibrionales bacterium]